MSQIDRIRELMSKAGDFDALLISEISNVQWASGFTGSSGWVILTQKEGLFLTDSRYTIQAQTEVRGLDVATYASPTTATQFLAENIRGLDVKSLAFESEFVSVATFTEWQNAFKPTQLVSKKNFLAPLRMIKTPEEIDGIRRSCALADACFEHVKRLIQPGVTEFDIGLEIEFFFRRQRAELAFDPAVVSGTRSAMPHGKPSGKVLEKGDFVTLDFGAKLDELCSDITRTVVVDKASARHREVYEQVLKSQKAALEAMKPGVPARDIDRISREVLKEKDLDKYFGHGLGHGLGRVVHDVGRMNPTSDDILREGQVWTVEPGVYIEGFGGVRIEDDVVVTKDGIEILTKSPKNLMELSLQSA